ncbi:MAG TPA: 30S ribosomal protein THX [Lentimicrobium sp.]|nr:30S ribosomal protein THX [Lentimicrobium sp.]
MGKGDKKTKRGKIILGSHGVRRPARKGKPTMKPMMVKEPVIVETMEPVKPKPKPRVPKKTKEEQKEE